jgi:drug/metabolite transporter (DMT)-like permease
MVNLLTFIFFFVFTTAGMIFIKFGGDPSHPRFLTVPVIDFKLTLLSLIGFLLYGFSFLLYSSLLQKYELTFLNPVTIGITSILIFISGVVFFNEHLSFIKIASLALILSGVLLINFFK